MKRLFLLATIIMGLTACSNIDEDERLIYVEPAEVNRPVLIEDFTGQACVNCPNATAAIHELQETYGEENVIAVAIHCGPFAHLRSNMGNAFLSDLGTKLGDEYYTHWNIEAQPGVKINRGAPIYDTNQYAAAVANELKKTSTVHFDAVEFSNNAVLVDMSSSDRVEGRLQVWIVEDSINAKDPQTKYQQFMPDGSRRQDYVHNHVFRASLTNDAYGEPVTLEAGNKSYTQVFYLQGNEALDNFEHLWQKQNLSAVVFFWNEQQGVMQAIRVPFKM
ncbi:MAG: Omp28 family outer membrane lipoprotein [Prevotella sp.]|nr:Omp28 family outer membrane lipoprotein [Prevotella sp.]